MVAVGKVYVTHRQEPERQTLSKEVPDFVSAVSGLCQLSVFLSAFTYPLTSVAQVPFVLSVPVNLNPKL